MSYPTVTNPGSDRTWHLTELLILADVRLHAALLEWAWSSMSADVDQLAERPPRTREVAVRIGPSAP